VTIRLHRFIIGNAWGRPPALEGPEHYWLQVIGTSNEWESACAKHRIAGSEIFAGHGQLSLLFEHDPDKAKRCEACLTIYLGTGYGQRNGVQSPGWTPMEGEIYPSEEID
jgi:hypothetical protein